MKKEKFTRIVGNRVLMIFLFHNKKSPHRRWCGDFSEVHSLKSKALADCSARAFIQQLKTQLFLSLIAACAAAKRAIGTRYGEQET